ncbi:MAG: hotdog fold thioesterase [Erythrobacter sp.]
MTKEPAIIEREQLEEMLRIAPFHQWLGIEIKSHSADQLQLLMPWRNEIVSNPMLGAAHGGVLAALIDLTGLYTLLAMRAKVKATADLRVDYHRPATSGPFTATGRIVKIGRQISVAETNITGPEGKLVASGRGAYTC